MNPLQRADIPASEQEIVIQDLIRKWKDGVEEVRKCFPNATLETTEQVVRSMTAERLAEEEVWINEKYQVYVHMKPGEMLAHVSIRTLDRAPSRDWRDFQAIKNQLFGPECEGVELYPAESRKVDTACQYHIWCITDSTYRFPFGFTERLVSDTPIGKSHNRPIDEADKIRNQSRG